MVSVAAMCWRRQGKTFSSKGSRMKVNQYRTVRASTMQKLSKRLVVCMIDFCDRNRCGIIVRDRGFERGYTSTDLEQLTDLSGLCVRKGWDTPIGWESVGV